MTRASKRKAAAPVATTKAVALKEKKGKASVKSAGKQTANDTATSKRRTSDDPYDFDVDQEMYGVTVKWVNKGQTTSEWKFTVPTDATVDALRGMVHETTGGVLTKDNITLKHKSRTMEPTDAQLGSFGVRDGSDIVLILNNDGQGVPAAPTMVNTQFPGEPVAKKSKKAKDKGGDKKRERFSQSEAEDLIKGVQLFGLGQWAHIKSSFFQDTSRSGVDLKDKWRNLVTASERPPGFKFRVEYLNDASFLARVAQVNAESQAK